MRASLTRLLGRDALLGIPAGAAAGSPLRPLHDTPTGDIATTCRRCYTAVACVDVIFCGDDAPLCDICLVVPACMSQVPMRPRYASVSARIPKGTTTDLAEVCPHGFFQVETLAARVPHPADAQRVAVVLLSVPGGVGSAGGRCMSFSICERHFVVA